MFSDRIYFNSSPNSSALRSGKASTPVVARKNVKFALSSNHSSSTERLNTSFNRGKDGIFRPKSIFSLATEIDFESSRLSRHSALSNPRLAGARQRERSVPRSVDTISSSSYPSSRSRTLQHGRSFESKSDFYSNFKENLSYLRSTSSSYYGKHGSSYVPSSYQVYRFTNAYYAPKLRDRPLLSNLNLKFSSRQSSQAQSQPHHTSAGSTGSSHKESVSSTNSSTHNSVSSSNDTLRPGLERNKFLIKFRERDLSKNVSRRSSISWDIPDINNNVSTPSVPETIEENSVLPCNGSAQTNGDVNDNQLARWKGSFALNAGGDDEQPELTCKVPEPELIKETREPINNCFEVLESKEQVTVPILHSALIKSPNKTEAKPEKIKKKNKVAKTSTEEATKDVLQNHSDNKATPSLSTSNIEHIEHPPESSTPVKAPEPKLKDDACQVEPKKKKTKPKLEKQATVSTQEEKATDKECSISVLTLDKTNEPPKKSKPTAQKSKVFSNQNENEVKLSLQPLVALPCELKNQDESPSTKKPSNTKVIANDKKKLVQSIDKLVSTEKENQSLIKPDDSNINENNTIKTNDKIKSPTPEPAIQNKNKTSEEIIKTKKTKSPQEAQSTIEIQSKLNVVKNDKVSQDKQKEDSPPKSPSADTKTKANEKQKVSETALKKPKVKKSLSPIKSPLIQESENKTTVFQLEIKLKENKNKETSEQDVKVIHNAQDKVKQTSGSEIKLDVASKSKLEKDLKSKEPSPLKSPTTKPELNELHVSNDTVKIPKKSKSKLEVAAVSKETESNLIKKSKSVKKVKVEESRESKYSTAKEVALEISVVSKPKKKLAKPKGIEASVEPLTTLVYVTSEDAVNQPSPSKCLELRLPSKPVETMPETKVSKVTKKKKKESTSEDNAEKSVKKKKKVKASTELTCSEVAPTPSPLSSSNDTQTANKENQKPYRKSKTDTLECSQLAQSKPVSKKPQKIRFREYNIDDFVFLTVLGRGSFGKVMLAELRNHEHYFAIKCLKKYTVIEDDDVESIMIERKVLAFGSQSPFICKLFCTFQTDSHLFFAMEWCAGGDLMFHVQKEGKFTEEKARFYAAEMVCALWFLHKRGIIYRDLKLDNVMVANDGHIRLVDFGMCIGKMYREELLPSNFCGTPEYMAPEIIKGIKYNNSVDWWALGVVIYEMCVGSSPFQGTDEDELLWNVCNTDVHYPRFLSINVKNLCALLLKKNPTERMGMPTCLQGDITCQTWFQGVNWKAFEECKVQPPFIPQLVHEADVSYFDQYFTKEEPCITPCNKTISDKDQQLFEGFNYTNPNLTE